MYRILGINSTWTKKLGNKKRVTVREFKGKILIDIREVCDQLHLFYFPGSYRQALLMAFSFMKIRTQKRSSLARRASPLALSSGKLSKSTSSL